MGGSVRTTDMLVDAAGQSTSNTLFDGSQRKAVRGADGHWYLADETGKRPDVLHLSRDDSEANRHGGGGGDTVHRSLRLEER